MHALHNKMAVDQAEMIWQSFQYFGIPAYTLSSIPASSWPLRILKKPRYSKLYQYIFSDDWYIVTIISPVSIPWISCKPISSAILITPTQNLYSVTADILATHVLIHTYNLQRNTRILNGLLLSDHLDLTYSRGSLRKHERMLLLVRYCTAHSWCFDDQRSSRIWIQSAYQEHTPSCNQIDMNLNSLVCFLYHCKLGIDLKYIHINCYSTEWLTTSVPVTWWSHLGML